MKKLLKNTKGQDLIEYALMAGVVAMAAAAILPEVASAISTIFTEVAAALPPDATQAATGATN